MIISKTPFRISFVGGGSDLKSFYKYYSGAVISTSIDKYIYLSMHKYFHQSKYLIKYSQTEEVSSINRIKHNIIREVFRYYSIKNIDFNSTADIPSGTGMGSSSAFTCGLINLCSQYRGEVLPSYEIAKLASHFEIEVLNEPIGKQDQYGCAIGGLKFIQFNPDDSVEIKPILLSYNNLLKLQNNLLLFYTDTTRAASSILNEQNQNTKSSSKVRDNIRSMSDLAKQLYFDLNKGNVDLMGEYLRDAWEVKKSLASMISTPEIEKIYKIGLSNGATGGKLLGAGGGGFILFYVEESHQDKLRNALKPYRELPFDFDYDGTKIIYNNQEMK